MGIFGGQSSQERYYSKPISQIYSALVAAAQSPGFRLKDADDLSMSVTVATGVSMTTWGETLTATCHPTGEGTTVQVGATGKAMSTVWQSSRNAKVIGLLFSRITDVLHHRETPTGKRSTPPNV